MLINKLCIEDGEKYWHFWSYGVYLGSLFGKGAGVGTMRQNKTVAPSPQRSILENLISWYIKSSSLQSLCHWASPSQSYSVHLPADTEVGSCGPRGADITEPVPGNIPTYQWCVLCTVLWQEKGYTMKFRLSLREISRAKSEGFPKGLGYITLYIHTWITIQTYSITILQY